MGAQDEYLRNFCILLTDKGVVPLTDPLQIAVYESLLKGMKRPSDLSTELGLGSSSLHFIIDKMAESGIIYKTKPDSDKKTVYYSTSAIRILGSMADNQADKKAQNDTKGKTTRFTSVSSLFDDYMSEIGVDMSHLKERYASALAASLGLNKSANMEDAILATRDNFIKYTGYTFTVLSFSPLTLVVSGGEDVIVKSKMLMQFVIGLLKCTTDRAYKVLSIENFNGREDMAKVTIDRCEAHDEPYINMTLHHKDEPKFIMLDLDGAAGLMTSDVQISIVDAMYERPLCITDIVNKVDAPRSTITSNLLRMVEEGVVSVFYSESGSAYYGLASSILIRKNSEMAFNESDISNTLDAVKEKDGSYMEGFFLYSLAYMKCLGFDTECLMIVLGARYMRSCETATPSNFDFYFGKMSDVAKGIGLSLNIVSVYPLTIGITVSDASPGMSQAVTFVKGMAHQGLEMASKGIFVRNSDMNSKEENISFKEIYPALSMTPVKGVKVENLGAPSPAVKKRTSSVKTALLNRSNKESGKPARTMRYITGFSILMLFAAAMFVGVAGFDNVDGKGVTLAVDDGIFVYDEDGNEVDLNSIEINDVVYLKTVGYMDIGLVEGCMARLMMPDEGGTYKVVMDSSKHIEQLYDASVLESMPCTYSICSYDKASKMTSDVKMIDSEEYIKSSGGCYVSYNNAISVVADEGCSISIDGMISDKVVIHKLEFRELEIKVTPTSVKRVCLGEDAYNYKGRILTGMIEVDVKVDSIELEYAAEKNVLIFADDVMVDLDSDNHFTLDLTGKTTVNLTSVKIGLY